MRGMPQCFVTLLVLALSLTLASPQTAKAQTAVAQSSSIGEIKLARDAFIRRAGTEIIASVGATIAEQDVLVTGDAGALGFILIDNSVITIGPSSVFRMTEFSFEPANDNVGFLGEIFQGTLEYISGKISEIATGAARFRTPYATVAARGTRMLIRGDR